MFQRVSSSIRIELIKQEQERIRQLLKKENAKSNIDIKKDLEKYLNFLELQVKIYPSLTKLNTKILHK
jgi:ribosomal protein RSM22 (predicted rRNA methylase)